MTTIMSERILHSRKRFPIVDYYLGYDIVAWKQGSLYYAKPVGWKGPILSAPTKPLLRRRIHEWWFEIQLRN
ncbi:MAG: hypothetical protein C3F02_03715 [Parcubacteria group bacterium]|nr:MAG: hypothetical protein C3F02_03715 [Parcubacteria group bacterium]